MLHLSYFRKPLNVQTMLKLFSLYFFFLIPPVDGIFIFRIDRLHVKFIRLSFLIKLCFIYLMSIIFLRLLYIIWFSSLASKINIYALNGVGAWSTSPTSLLLLTVPVILIQFKLFFKNNFMFITFILLLDTALKKDVSKSFIYGLKLGDAYTAPRLYLYY